MRTTKAIKACSAWLSDCVNNGWEKAELDALQALWWKHHDDDGNLFAALPTAPLERAGASVPTETPSVEEAEWFESDVVQDDNGQTFIATVGPYEVTDGRLHYEDSIYQILGNTREDCYVNLRRLMSALDAASPPPQREEDHSIQLPAQGMVTIERIAVENFMRSTDVPRFKRMCEAALSAQPKGDEAVSFFEESLWVSFNEGVAWNVGTSRHQVETGAEIVRRYVWADNLEYPGIKDERHETTSREPQPALRSTGEPQTTNSPAIDSSLVGDLDAFEGHTPGPWWQRINHFSRHEIITSAGQQLASIANPDDPSSPPKSWQECEANAHLIAAAPALLTEVKLARKEKREFLAAERLLMDSNDTLRDEIAELRRLRDAALSANQGE